MRRDYDCGWRRGVWDFVGGTLYSSLACTSGICISLIIQALLSMFLFQLSLESATIFLLINDLLLYLHSLISRWNISLEMVFLPLRALLSVFVFQSYATCGENYNAIKSSLQF